MGLYVQGIIALDIDGTLTAQTHALEQEVHEALYELHHTGWNFIFITGRPFHWGFETLRPLLFPYALAVQNGALLLQMPEQNILCRQYIERNLLPLLEVLCRDEQTDFVIYTGFENDDRCFYRPARLPPPILAYTLERTKTLREKWISLDDFSGLPVPYIASIKFFAPAEQASRISRWLEKHMGLHASPIRDPFNAEYFVVQATHQMATKGSVLQHYIHMTGAAGPIIAAGDDYNDRSMLELANVKVVMADAPFEILKMADVIAPPAHQNGIIQGLVEAIKLLSEV